MVVTSIYHEIDLWMSWSAVAVDVVLWRAGEHSAQAISPYVALTHPTRCVRPLCVFVYGSLLPVASYVDSMLFANSASHVSAYR